jgi:predicted Zn finger-like uncharacterized protein
MLITTCAHCRARFRVTPQQLNARQGQVRCGNCQQVFNGFEALERFPDDDTGGRLLAAKEAEERAQRESVADVQALPDQMPEFESVDVPGPPTAPLEDDARAAPEPQAAAPATAPSAASDARPVETPARPRPRVAAPELTLEVEPPRPPSRAWSFGVVLLTFVLGAELAYAYRAPLAQRYPALRPTLESICARLECTVAYSRDESQLKLEDSELLEVPGKPNEIALNARVRNLASVAQEYPHLELTLTDLTGQAAVRRVLRPTDYLGRPLAVGEVIAPGVEVALQLRLETPRVKATGYELLLFYP